MTIKRNGLGRNLSALLGNLNPPLAEPKTSLDLINLNIHALKPGKYQPRTDIDETPLAELASSIKQQGLLQPLIVRELKDKEYEIIAGERRWRACELAGLTEIPVIIRQVDDETAMAIALVENLQRENLNAMDQARAIYRLSTDFDLTHQQIADLLAKSRAAVTNYLRLLSLAPEVRRFLEHGDLDMGHARALLMLNEEQQTQVACLVVAKNLSVRETEKIVARFKINKEMKIEKLPELNPVIQDRITQIAEQLKTKIKIKPGKTGKGSLVLQYNNQKDLEILLEQLSNVTS